MLLFLVELWRSERLVLQGPQRMGVANIVKLEDDATVVRFSVAGVCNKCDALFCINTLQRYQAAGWFLLDLIHAGRPSLASNSEVEGYLEVLLRHRGVGR